MSSQEWGTLVSDWTPAPSSPASQGRDRDPNAGAWPEDMETRFYADSSMTIPGQQDPPGDCGEWGPRRFCDSCADVELGPHRCQRRICRDCWLTWRGNRTEKAVSRLAGYRRLQGDSLDARLTHTMVSPPPGSIKTLVDVQQAWRDVYDLAEEAGVRGGVVLFHGWRVKKEYQELWREIRDDVDGGIWRWVRENGKKDWRSMTYWSPHWHIIGPARDISEPEDTEWRVRRLSTFSKFNIYEEQSYRNMAKGVSYVLSHLGFNTEETSHSIRWYGELANNQKPLDELEDWERTKINRMTAKVCGSDPDDLEDGDGPAEPEECDCDDCNGHLKPIYDAGFALSDFEFCDAISVDAERRLEAAFRWAIGDVGPPPGMKSPMTEENAEEVLSLLTR